jgi:hypothetical protein
MNDRKNRIHVLDPVRLVDDDIILQAELYELLAEADLVRRGADLEVLRR